ncbi:helix-turn-helix domain-containing protein [Feifania hominis]|uniref:Helix-turn-helix transcriptional regulator n=1 Tax=Feifania hominis TaxID=2763660 RepID=A0A926HTY1_9FIRM|nr:helix-turn-helix transcriptional regulator [Feifania hominis]MBC8535370.1 helix-turn-helix transcriptional regulator [Feifania hominis]
MHTNFEDKYITLGLKVAYYRKKKGYTQETLADKIGKSWSFIAQLERPTKVVGASLETIFMLAEALEIPAYKLFLDD